MKHFHLIYERSNWTLKRGENPQPEVIYANLPKAVVIQRACLHLEDMEATLSIYTQAGNVVDLRVFPASHPELAAQPVAVRAVPRPALDAWRLH